MAAIASAVVVAAGSAYSASRQSSAAKDAARTQQRGTDAAIAENQRQFDAMMEMTAPRRQVEGNALNLLARMTGVPGADGAPAGAPDYSAFFNSPDYQFALGQGQQAVERSAAARGNLRSGNTLAALTQYGQGMATQNIGQYMNRLMSLAGMGATDNAANAMMQQGQNIGQLQQQGANQRASGIVGSANAWSNFAGQMGQLGGYALDRWGGNNPNANRLLTGAATTFQVPPANPQYPGATPGFGDGMSSPKAMPYGASRNYLYGGNFNG